MLKLNNVALNTILAIWASARSIALNDCGCFLERRVLSSPALSVATKHVASKDIWIDTFGRARLSTHTFA